MSIIRGEIRKRKNASKLAITMLNLKLFKGTKLHVMPPMQVLSLDSRAFPRKRISGQKGLLSLPRCVSMNKPITSELSTPFPFKV